MILTDPFYGALDFSKVIEELLVSDVVLRLKKIHQGGAVFLVNQELNHTRFEHSVGVMMLIKFLGGTEKEQIAGLLHDISHTSFSHVVDYVLENKSEDYHEKIYSTILTQSEVPAILFRYGYSVNDLINDQFSILEQPLPNLCADRLDYFFRDLFYARLISIEEIHRFLKDLVIYEGRIMVSGTESGQWVRDKFRVLQNNYFEHPENLYANQSMTELLKMMLSKKVISQQDFHKDDEYILELINADQEGKILLNRIIEKAGLKEFLKSGHNLRIKKRNVDPEIIVRNHYCRLSELASE